MGDPQRVIIVGAGLAGLAAANALNNAGVETVVLEGRQRIGGRAWTEEVGGVPVDFGCSWIHQPVGNPLTRFATRSGVLQTSADVELDLATIRFFDQRDGQVPLPDAMDAWGHLVRFFEEAEAISDELGVDASIRDGAMYYLDREGVSGDARRRAAFALRLFTELPDSVDWSLGSLWNATHVEVPYVGIGQGNFPVGGYGRIIHSLAGDTDVRLGHRVTKVAVEPTGVRVTAESDDGTVALTGSHVIVTVPLGVLKANAIVFEPGLPAERLGATSRLGFGQVEKLILRYDEPFWEEGGHTHIVHLSERVPQMEFPTFMDLHRLTGQPVLVAFMAAAFARHLSNATEAEARTRATGVLEEIFGQPLPPPRDFARTGWWQDPMSLGAYSSTWLGSSPADLDELAEPLGGRLLFAGEATNSVRWGYADGALTTGIREAKRLLQRSTVTLTPHA